MFDKRITQQFLILVLLLLATSSAFAQATRTWVSGVGDDANPCSRTAPCKTFAGAISKTFPGGTIDALDPGGFGAVTITKAITIEAVGTVASVLVAGTNGIVIAAGASDVVTLRGLTVEGTNGSGLNGIRFTGGAKLIVEHCVVQGFSQNGIDFEPSAASTLLVTDTTVNNTTGAVTAAVFVQGSGATPSASLDRTRLVQNAGFGLQVKNGIVEIRHSTVSQNAFGINSFSSASTARITVDDVIVADNSSSGVTTSGSQATIALSRSTVTNNSTGIGGKVSSFGDNRIFNNVTDGTPFGTNLTLR